MEHFDYNQWLEKRRETCRQSLVAAEDAIEAVTTEYRELNAMSRLIATDHYRSRRTELHLRLMDAQGKWLAANNALQRAMSDPQLKLF